MKVYLKGLGFYSCIEYVSCADNEIQTTKSNKKQTTYTATIEWKTKNLKH